MLALETLKNTLKPQKTQNNTIYARTRARAQPARAPAPADSSHALTRAQLRSGAAFACAQAQPACFLQPSEPSPGLTSFLQPHHFQGNSQCLNSILLID
jgi:hypothetical protein